MSIPEAREESARLSGAVRKDADPLNERKAAEAAVEAPAEAAKTGLERAEAYLAFAATKLKPGTLDQSRRNLIKYAEPLHKLPLPKLHRADIAALHDKLTRDAGPIQANRVRATISAFLTWAEYRGEVEENVAGGFPTTLRRPASACSRTTRSPPSGRRQPTAGELSSDRRLALLTGCRRGESAACAGRSSTSPKLWTIPAERMKGKVAHEVPLSALALAQLPPRRPGSRAFCGEEAAFQGWSGKGHLDETLEGIDLPWTLHDLRRTISTRINGAGVAPHIVEAVLAHRNFKSGVAGIYNRASYRPEKRAALELWAELVATIVDPAEISDLPKSLPDQPALLRALQ